MRPPLEKAEDGAWEVYDREDVERGSARSSSGSQPASAPHGAANSPWPVSASTSSSTRSSKPQKPVAPRCFRSRATKPMNKRGMQGEPERFNMAVEEAVGTPLPEELSDSFDPESWDVIGNSP